MRTYFVSSTFRDMEFDRDLINRFVLPKFRAAAREHGEHADTTDLRIGIDTSDLDLNAAMRKVLKICRQEINRSKPFMIILLGEKYGSLIRAEHLPNGFTKPEKIIGKSVTEFEIDYGLFENRSVKCLICFRTLRRDEFSAEDGKKFFDAADSDDAKKLAELKDKLRREYGDKIIKYTADWNGKELENFRTTDGREFADVLVERMKADCLTDWAEFEKLPWQKQERQAAWEYASRKAAAFVGREDLIADLEKTFAGDDRIIFLSGARGTGKTGLLSKAAVNLRDNSRRVCVIFAGNSPYSETAQKILEQMVFFLEETLNREHITAEGNKDFYSRCQLRLKELANQIEPTNPVWFVIDAVDRLSADRHKDFLDFLPNSGNVRCLVSCADTFDLKKAIRAHDSMREKKLEPLTDAEVPEILGGILQQKRRQLFKKVADAVNEKSGRNSPLYLEMVAQVIDMISAEEFDAAQGMNALAELAARLVKKLPDEPETAAPYIIEKAARTLCTKPDAVLEAVNLVAISRHGLRLSDLKQLTTDFTDLDDALLRRYLDGFFSEQQGRITFSHDLIREGVRGKIDKEYRRREEKRIAAHVKELPVNDMLRCLDGAACAQEFNDYKFLATLYGEAFTTNNPLLIYGITQALLSDGGLTCCYMLKYRLNDFDEKIAAPCYGFLQGNLKYMLMNSVEDWVIKRDILAALPPPSEKIIKNLFKFNLDSTDFFLPKSLLKKLLRSEFFIEHMSKIYVYFQELRLAEISFDLGDFKSVKIRCKKICRWGEKNFNPMYGAVMSGSYNMLSDAYFFMGYCSEAVDAARQCIRWAKHVVKILPIDKYRLELAGAYAKAAIRESALEQPSLKKILCRQKKAREIYTELLEKSNEIAFWAQAASNALDIARTHLKMGNPEKAVLFIKEAERRTEELLIFHADNLEMIIFIVDMYGSLAVTHIDMKNPKARTCIKKSLELCRKAYEINRADYLKNAEFNMLLKFIAAYREVGDEVHALHYEKMAQDFRNEN